MVWEQNSVWFFCYFNFEKNYDVLKSKKPCILLNKNITFNKSEAESKMENLSHSFREMNLVLQLIWESQIKSKTVRSWSSRKVKKGIFCTVYFVQRKFVLTFVFCLNVKCIEYTFRIYILLPTKKIVESLQCILNYRKKDELPSQELHVQS